MQIINRVGAPDVHRQQLCVPLVKLQAWVCMLELACQANEAELYRNTTT